MEKISKDQLLKYINVMIERTFYDTSMNQYERFAFPVFKMKDDVERGKFDINEPVGRWIRDLRYLSETYGCSECGFLVTRLEGFNYCPKCGTKMEVDD